MNEAANKIKSGIYPSTFSSGISGVKIEFSDKG